MKSRQVGKCGARSAERGFSRRSIAPRSGLHSLQFRPGFTLVEMLVSVALVLLMMMMFASVFQEASRSMTQQKGMAENDQKARMAVILLRNDLGYQDPITSTWRGRTFRTVKPFQHQGSVLTVPFDQHRRGYFYIAENQVADGTDDVLQLTVEIPSSELPFSGRTVLLKTPADTVAANGTIDLASTTGTTETLSPHSYLVNHRRNQPEFDDGQTSVNNTGSSHYAEVCYFVRAGNLHRRVMLIRNPYDDEGTGSAQPSMIASDYAASMEYHNPSDPNDVAVNPPPFWRHFDYSAFHQSGAGPQFHDARTDLSNSSSTGQSLGIPRLRFGHNVADGRPREFLDLSTNPPTGFIGRFTHRETSDTHFGYPGRQWWDIDDDGTSESSPLSVATPLRLGDGVWQLPDGTASESGRVYYDSQRKDGTNFDTVFDGTRRGEEILLSNVLEFDIKVWDDGITTTTTSGTGTTTVSTPAFVDLGHSITDNGTATGHYNAARNLNAAYGNRYDTWHPLATGPGTGAGASNAPPYLPVTNGADGQPGVIDVDDDGNGTIDDDTEQGWSGSDDVVHPLKAIQITIRYYDVSSAQVRQLTIVHSLTYP